MKFCVQILLYNVENYILRTLEDCGPFVEKIYVAYSPVPYSDYNPAARDLYTNKTDPALLRQSRWFHKIELIQNNWANETDQRNECLAAARRDGMDVMIVQDADEFFHPEDYKRNLETMEANPGHDYYVIHWYLFWKTTRYIIQHSNGDLIEESASFAINLRRDVKFANRRKPASKDYFILPGRCYHLAFVHSDASMVEKINTWSHSGDFERDTWYLAKWACWRPGTRSLNPIWPANWRRAVPYDDPLPPALKGFTDPAITYRRPSFQERIRIWRFDCTWAFRNFLRQTKRRLKRGFGVA